MHNMLEGFYNFIADKINKYFQTQSNQGTLQRAESFCLKLDDEEMVQGVGKALEKLAENNNCKGSFDFICGDGSIYKTFTLITKNTEVIVAEQIKNITDDFLGATIRNVANDKGMPLLLITSKPIDSALSGTRDMSAFGMPFCADQIINDIREMIDGSKRLTEVEKCILQFEIENKEKDVFSDRNSLYEYKEFLSIMNTGKINRDVFPGFRLFFIDGKKDFSRMNPREIKKELENNNKLFEKIDRSIKFENIETDLEKDFEDKFINQIIEEKNRDADLWSRNFTYEDILNALNNKQDKKDNPLQINHSDISVYRGGLPIEQYTSNSEFFIRNEGSQKNKNRKQSILIFNIKKFPQIAIQISCNIRLKNEGILSDIEKYEREGKNLIFTFPDDPDACSFHRIRLNDEVNKIKYEFHICILDLPLEYLIPTIRTNFIIKYRKGGSRIELVDVDTDLSFNQGAPEVVSQKLENQQTYYCDYKKRLNIYSSEDDLIDENGKINIQVKFANIEVPFTIETEEVLNKEFISGRKILKEKFANRDSFSFIFDKRIQRDSQEYKVQGDIKKELNLEKLIIKKNILFGTVKNYDDEDEADIIEGDLKISDPLRKSYFELLNCFDQKNTVPTLAYIGDNAIQSCAEKYIEVFQSEFSNLDDKTTLSTTQQNALKLGTLSFGDKSNEIWFTPFHPLNVAYQLALSKERGFNDVTDVALDRLNSAYLLPYIQFHKKTYKVADQMASKEWRHYAPIENKKYRGGRTFVPDLVKSKIQEFTKHFKYIFEEINNRLIKINLINMGDCREVLIGIARYFRDEVKKEKKDIEQLLQIELHIYTNDPLNNIFNILKDRNELQKFLENENLSIDANLATTDLKGILFKNVKCYMMNDDGKDYRYAHITFYEMESQLTSERTPMGDFVTGTSLGGILSGMTSDQYGNNYRTGFGLKYSDEKSKLIQIAKLLNELFQVNDSGNPYQQNLGISTQIDSSATDKMDDIYDASNWVVFVEPKVNLDFFSEKEASNELLIIHYNDQYTSSSGYDAITVTRKSDQYSKVIADYLGEKNVITQKDDISKIINLFNAVNGEWLLKLISAKKFFGVNQNSNFSREKISIVAAIKFMLGYLKDPKILWIPLSMEEVLRVSGGVGLSEKDGILSAKNLGFDKGATSDDLLFVGICENNKRLEVYFYPTEVKTGINNSSVIDKANKQVLNTAKGLKNALNPSIDDGDISEISYRVNRNFMMQLLINSCKKMQVYRVDESQNWNFVLDQVRRDLLNEEYIISDRMIKKIGKGSILSFKTRQRQRTTLIQENGINYIELPESDEFNLILKTPEEINKELNNETSDFLPTYQTADEVNQEEDRSINVPEVDDSKNDDNEENNRVILQTDEISLDEDHTRVDSNSVFDVIYYGDDREEEEFKVAETKEEISKNRETLEAVEEQSDKDELDQFQKEQPKGMQIKFGTNQLNGEDVIWEPNNTDQVFHTNTGIIGTMGTGKTQFTKSIITQLYRQQNNNIDHHNLGILIFDYKGDYNESKKDFVEATNAKIYRPYHLPFNPLALTKTSVDTPLLPIHTANAFKDTLSRVYNLGNKQENSLFNCIIEAYNNKGIDEENEETWNNEPPTFENVYSIYENHDDIKKNDSLASAMSKLHQFRVFESDPKKTKALFDLLNGVVVIDLSRYDPDIQSLVIAITLDLFYAQMQATGSSKLDGKYRQLTKLILVDEADNFMQKGFPSLKNILKEGREFGVGTILSTQFLKHFASGSDNYSSYILTWVVHSVSDLKASDVDFVFNTEAKSNEEEKLFNDIKVLEKHHSIVKIGTQKPVYVEDLPFYKLIEQN